MEEYIDIVEKEIGYFNTLIGETNHAKGYGLERRSAIVWDTLEHNLKGYIDNSVYMDLENRWSCVVSKVYSNENLCIN